MLRGLQTAGDIRTRQRHRRAGAEMQQLRAQVEDLTAQFAEFRQQFE